MSEFGKAHRLREVREQLGVTLEEVAEAAGDLTPQKVAKAKSQRGQDQNC